MLTENPPTCYEELTESIRSAASTATHATHQLSRISEATKKMMLSRFQMIHAGQTKNADLAKINNEVRRSLENDLDKWREVKSLEAAIWYGLDLPDDCGYELLIPCQTGTLKLRCGYIELIPKSCVGYS
uniref:Uncharacterized protein n=1 Tax=Caenorhabditis japonica TaxID=281687 RepID=A0A8R1EI31_CAEJA